MFSHSVMFNSLWLQGLQHTRLCCLSPSPRDGMETNIIEHDNHLLFNDINYYLSNILYVEVPDLIFWTQRRLRSPWISPVIQWLRMCLSVQGTRVWPLVREDPICLKATKPAHHKYWTCALEPMACNMRSHCNEKPSHLHKEQLTRARTRESLRASTKTQRNQK